VCYVLCSISYVEIYNETMFDLLSPLPSSIGTQSALYVTEDENGTYVKGLSTHLVQTEEEALNLLFEVNLFFFFNFIWQQ
jgi:kinesin family protein 6/9